MPTAQCVAPLESIRRIKIKDLKVTPLGEELANSEAMRPYLSYAIAELKGSAQAMQDSGAIIKNLPLEQRYIWRVLRALESGFADFDSYSIKLDLPHLDDVLKREMIEELTLRLQQLVILSRTLKGECRPFTDPPRGCCGDLPKFAGDTLNAVSPNVRLAI